MSSFHVVWVEWIVRTLLLGRPFGGCAIFFRRSLLPFVSCLDSLSKRFCSHLLHDQHGTSTLLICVYLPHNDGSSASHTEYLITLGELEGFINCHTSDHILIAGDFNVDFYRASMTLQHLRTLWRILIWYLLISHFTPPYVSPTWEMMAVPPPDQTILFVTPLLLPIFLSFVVWTLVLLSLSFTYSLLSL